MSGKGPTATRAIRPRARLPASEMGGSIAWAVRGKADGVLWRPGHDLPPDRVGVGGSSGHASLSASGGVSTSTSLHGAGVVAATGAVATAASIAAVAHVEAKGWSCSMTLRYRALSPEEIEVMFPPRHMDLREYEAVFRDAQPGQAFEIAMNGLATRVLKRRLTQACRHSLGNEYTLRYRLTGDGLLFQVRTA